MKSCPCQQRQLPGKIEYVSEKRWSLLHCLSALGGKHATIIHPAKGGSIYFHYKKLFYIVLMPLLDANYKFITNEIGQEGSACNTIIVNACQLRKAIPEREPWYSTG